MSCITSSTNIIKTSDEVRNVSMDFTNILDTGVTISSESVNVDPSGVVVSGTTVIDGIVYFTISGGTDGYNYMIEVTITTSDSQTIVGKGLLKIRDR